MKFNIYFNPILFLILLSAILFAIFMFSGKSINKRSIIEYIDGQQDTVNSYSIQGQFIELTYPNGSTLVLQSNEIYKILILKEDE